MKPRHMFVCLECSYAAKRMPRGYGCQMCASPVVKIDTEIVHLIVTLNLKGYPTLFCCSGHPGTRGGNIPFEGYIRFDEPIAEDTIYLLSAKLDEYARFEDNGQTLRWSAENARDHKINITALSDWVSLLPRVNQT